MKTNLAEDGTSYFILKILKGGSTNMMVLIQDIYLYLAMHCLIITKLKMMIVHFEQSHKLLTIYFISSQWMTAYQQ